MSVFLHQGEARSCTLKVMTGEQVCPLSAKDREYSPG